LWKSHIHFVNDVSSSTAVVHVEENICSLFVLCLVCLYFQEIYLNDSRRLGRKVRKFLLTSFICVKCRNSVDQRAEVVYLKRHFELYEPLYEP